MDQDPDPDPFPGLPGTRPPLLLSPLLAALQYFCHRHGIFTDNPGASGGDWTATGGASSVWHPAASCPVHISRNDHFCMFFHLQVLGPIYLVYMSYNPRDQNVSTKKEEIEFFRASGRTAL